MVIRKPLDNKNREDFLLTHFSEVTAHYQVGEKVIFRRLLKNAQMQGARIS